jgi:hypothetical protein
MKEPLPRRPEEQLKIDQLQSLQIDPNIGATVRVLPVPVRPAG